MKAEDQICSMADVPLEIAVELDQCIMSLRELLELDAGSIIRLHRSAGENIDILMGGGVAAFGEIVIIENTMGLRITGFNNDK